MNSVARHFSESLSNSHKTAHIPFENGPLDEPTKFRRSPFNLRAPRAAVHSQYFRAQTNGKREMENANWKSVSVHSLSQRKWHTHRHTRWPSVENKVNHARSDCMLLTPPTNHHTQPQSVYYSSSSSGVLYEKTITIIQKKEIWRQIPFECCAQLRNPSEIADVM